MLMKTLRRTMVALAFAALVQVLGHAQNPAPAGADAFRAGSGHSRSTRR